MCIFAITLTQANSRTTMVWQQWQQQWQQHQLSVAAHQPFSLACFLPCLPLNGRGHIRVPLCNEPADSSTDTGGRRFWRETGTSTSTRWSLQVARTEQLGHGTSVFRGRYSLQLSRHSSLPGRHQVPSSFYVRYRIRSFCAVAERGEACPFCEHTSRLID